MTIEKEAQILWQTYFDKLIEVMGSGDGSLASDFAIIHLKGLIKYAKTFGDTTISDIKKWEKMINYLNK